MLSSATQNGEGDTDNAPPNLDANYTQRHSLDSISTLNLTDREPALDILTRITSDPTHATQHLRSSLPEIHLNGVPKFVPSQNTQILSVQPSSNARDGLRLIPVSHNGKNPESGVQPGPQDGIERIVNRPKDADSSPSSGQESNSSGTLSTFGFTPEQSPTVVNDIANDPSTQATVLWSPSQENLDRNASSPAQHEDNGNLAPPQNRRSTTPPLFRTPNIAHPAPSYHSPRPSSSIRRPIVAGSSSHKLETHSKEFQAIKKKLTSPPTRNTQVARQCGAGARSMDSMRNETYRRETGPRVMIVMQEERENRENTKGRKRRCSFCGREAWWSAMCCLPRKGKSKAAVRGDDDGYWEWD